MPFQILVACEAPGTHRAPEWLTRRTALSGSRSVRGNGEGHGGDDDEYVPFRALLFSTDPGNTNESNTLFHLDSPANHTASIAAQVVMVHIG